MTIEELPSPTRDGELPAADVPKRPVSRPLIVGAGAVALVGVGILGILVGWTIGPPSGWGPSPSPALASAFAQTPGPSGPPDASVSHRAGSLSFSLAVGAGWQSFGPSYPNYITRSVGRQEGAEALIYWTNVAGIRVPMLAAPCHYLRTQRPGLPSADLAAVLAAAPGTDLITGPSEVTLGGYPAQHVALTVREDVGCDPGFFFTYPNVFGGALWTETAPGDLIRVWIIDVEGDLLFIAGETRPNASAGLEQDVVDIVQSIQFE